MPHSTEDIYAALRRYEAMAGVISSIPYAVERRGEEDR